MNAPIKLHHYINMFEYYHRLLQQIYTIITTKIPNIEPNLVFKTFFKAINNGISSNKLVTILLVFSI